MAIFETKVTVPGDLDDVFAFFLRPENLVKISPPEMGLSLVEAPEVLELGSQLRMKIQGFGTVQNLLHEIIALEQPRRFTEKQIQGPLKLWFHDHLFESTGPNEVTITDRIEFEPPGGLLGFLVTESRLREQLEENFDYQHEALKKHLQ